MSSMRSSAGPRPPFNSRSSDSKMANGPPPAITNRPRLSRAMSCSGPSGSGVARCSQPPTYVRASPRLASTKPSASDVLPMPASPSSDISRPRPWRADSSACSMAAQGVARSSRVCGPGMEAHRSSAGSPDIVLSNAEDCFLALPHTECAPFDRTAVLFVRAPCVSRDGFDDGDHRAELGPLDGQLPRRHVHARDVTVEVECVGAVERVAEEARKLVQVHRLFGD